MGERCDIYIKRTPLQIAVCGLFIRSGSKLCRDALTRLISAYDYTSGNDYTRITHKDGVIVECRQGDYYTYANNWMYPEGGYTFITNEDDFRVHCTLICNLITKTLEMEEL